MALNPGASYPSQTTAGDPAYPQGKARNRALPGDGTGFPWTANVANDILGFQQALLAAAGITPSGVPDGVGASDYLSATLALIRNTVRKVAADAALANAQNVAVATGITQYSKAACHDGVSSFLSVGDLAEIEVAYAYGNGRIKCTAGSSFTGLLSACWADATKMLIGGEGGEIQLSTNSGVTWVRKAGASSLTPYQVLGFGYSGSKWMAVTFGGDVAISNDASTWSLVTAIAAITYKVLYVARLGAWFASTNDSTVYRSTDDGTTWNASTGTPTGLANYALVDTGTTLVAGGKDGQLFTSLDGITWTARTSGLTTTEHIYHLVAVNGVLIGSTSRADTTVIWSVDDGVTWTLSRVHAGNVLGAVVGTIVAATSGIEKGRLCMEVGSGWGLTKISAVP
jgi:hypothetical protein